ncbi:MAG: GerW family sporulation protein [Thermomicrobiales bacterium]
MIATRSEPASSFEGLFSRVLERIRANVNVDLTCGESRTVGDTTIIPIGVVTYGFGFGMGSRPSANAEADSRAAQEGGGGGGAWIQPIAIVTVTNGQTKVIPVLDWARVLTGVVGVIGKLLLSRGVQGRSVIGPGSMTVLPRRGKRAHHRKDSDEETNEQEA